VKTRVKEALAEVPAAGLTDDDRLALERDLARIGGYVRHLRNLPHARGLAIFACEARGLFLCVPLPRVHRTRLVIDERPRIAELVAALQDARPVIAAVLDRVVARFFLVGAEGTEELPGAFTLSGRGGRYHSDRQDAPGEGERRYHGRMAEERHRHYTAIAKRLGELAAQYPESGIILGGPVDHTTALSALLPGPLGARVLGSCRLNPTAVATAKLRAAADALAEQHERTRVTAELVALEESIGEGRAVEGARETLSALARHQVRALYIGEDVEGADKAVEDALQDSARVVVVSREIVPQPMDGLAATLRFQ
jgi:peptide chain release factor subunit 1